MTWLIEDDVKAQCTPEDLEVLSQSDDDAETAAEARTISFFSGYLSRFDLTKIFVDYSGTIPDPDPRHQALLMFVIDYFLYTLYAAQPDRLIPDMRVRRRDEAVKWLEDVQKGITAPDLPTVNTDTETDINNPIQYGFNTKVSSMW